MAGGGSGEEENYWPGFVDALTTMVMVLTFIMMILGIVVFSMSKNKSKNIVEAVATAAKIDRPAGATPEQVLSKIIEVLEARAKSEKSPVPADEKTPPPPPVALEAPKTPASPDAKTEAARAEAKAEAAKIDAAKAEAKVEEAKIELAKIESKIEAAKAELVKTETAKPETFGPPNPPQQQAALKLEVTNPLEGEQKTLAMTHPQPDVAKKIDVAPQTDKEAPRGASISPAPNVLTIIFKERTVQLDDASAKLLQDTVKGMPMFKGNQRLEIKGFANVASSAISEERRAAYYRAMVVRSQLMTTGITPDRISVRVTDAQPSENDMVRIYLAP